MKKKLRKAEETFSSEGVIESNQSLNSKGISANEKPDSGQTQSIDKVTEMTIIVEKLDRKFAERILKIVNRAEQRKVPHLLVFILSTTNGEINAANSVIYSINRSRYVNLHTISEGELGIAETLLAAFGEPGNRLVRPGTTFQLINRDPFTDNEELIESLKKDGNSHVHDLTDITGRRKATLTAICKESTVSAETAKKLNIIDSIIRIRSKYRK
jgi:hypothetical protein